MTNVIFANELRISLKDFSNLDVFQFTSLNLSSRHKRHIETFLRGLGWVALFEGDVLFAVIKSPSNISDEKANFLKALEGELLKFNQANLKTIKLTQVPQRVTERISFAIISFQAAKQGIFQIHNRILFRPTSLPEKLSHRALETTVSIEDGFIKIYLTPTWIALLNIKETYREQLSSIQLVHLCKFRTKELCNLANGDGSCPYVHPEGLGYYDNEIGIDLLDQGEDLIFRNHYKECPQLKNITKVTLTKTTKKAKKFSVHPTFTVFARISKSDLQAHPTWSKQYRDATLMSSKKRWQETMKWIQEIFPQADLSAKICKTQISMDDVQIPINILITTPIESSPNIYSYQSVYFPDQPIVNDQQDRRGKNLSGGWLFNNQGSYDRNDVKRQFDTIVPYLIVPSESEIHKLTQSLFEILSDGEYQPRIKKGDQQFLGINRPESKAKYNAKFVNPWRAEEGIFTIENHNDPDEYGRAAQEIKRDWNSTSQKDLNRIAIVITPSSKENEDEMYFRLKKIFIEEGIPSQFISFETLQKLKNQSIAFGPILQSLWLNLYAKMGGKPWRLAGQLENVHCFVGIGFGLSTDQENKGKHIYAGVAHVFDRFGSWIDIASGSQPLSNPEYESFDGPQKYLQGTDSFKISETLTQEIVYNALRLYQQNQTQTHEPPQNIVIHKLGPVFECEVMGVLEGVRQILGTLEKCNLGIVQIEQDHQVRLYGLHSEDDRLDRTVLRGTGLIINKQKLALASTGSSQRKSGTFYSGIGTPQPLIITSILPAPSILSKYSLQSKQFYETLSLARHIMSLTQLHWGSTKDNIRLPITAMYAQKVADLISKTKANVNTWASYHRPWFL